ncbi:DUF5788 family protein [Halosimplex salinum]|uniref:DUF5788 family protein n=1 Tax=Halosimplex salinum TaxID=1710538 RepID=UPI001F289D15|nr:DUF5788 family protein [Halosimplex salinum]
MVTGERSDGETPIGERKRQRLLDKSRRRSGTIGTDLPETITVQGTDVDLREFVFECQRLEAIPEDERERIEEMKNRLRRERLARRQRIAEDDITEAEAERLVDSISGLDRAINALEGLDEPSYTEQLRRKKIEDAEKLLSLIEQRP